MVSSLSQLSPSLPRIFGFPSSGGHYTQGTARILLGIQHPMLRHYDSVGERLEVSLPSNMIAAYFGFVCKAPDGAPEGMYERPDTDDEALQGCKLQYKLDLSAVTTGI